MKTVCRTMGLARSHVRDLLGRGEDWTDGRSHRTPSDDAGLLAELRQEIADLPSYGYRRACALVNRQRAARGAPRVNAKRVYRVMAQAALLLPKAPRRRQSARTHEGRVAVSRSDLRWCSDGLEIKCDSGQTVTAAFAKDCCDREVLAWRAWEGKGLPGEPVREMLRASNAIGSVEASAGRWSPQRGYSLRTRHWHARWLSHTPSHRKHACEVHLPHWRHGLSATYCTTPRLTLTRHRSREASPGQAAQAGLTSAIGGSGGLIGAARVLCHLYPSPEVHSALYLHLRATRKYEPTYVKTCVPLLDEIWNICRKTASQNSEWLMRLGA
ncbi:HTH-like domain protein [Pseudomonas aeruginosa]|nr:HTH-like domain protein [Pseudomonas aeruginosa]